MSDEDTREVIIHTPQGRPLLLQNGDIFSAAGTNVARVIGNVAYDPSGRYVGTIVDDRLVFDDTDSLTVGPLFVRTSHPGFVADVEAFRLKRWSGRLRRGTENCYGPDS